VPFRFPGQYQDPEDELYNNIHYNWHRWYIPAFGRYNRADPIHMKRNVYAYVKSNPLLNIDISGLLSEKCKNLEDVEFEWYILKVMRPRLCTGYGDACRQACDLYFIYELACCGRYNKLCHTLCGSATERCLAKLKGFEYPQLLKDACEDKYPDDCDPNKK